jgi:hypothetical protein
MGHPFGDGGLVHLGDGQGIGHIVEHVHMGPHGVALEHHAHPPLFGRQEHLVRGHQGVVDEDFPGGGLFKAGDHAQHGGLAAARRAQEGDKLPVLELFVKLAEDQVAAEGFGDIADGYA